MPMPIWFKLEIESIFFMSRYYGGALSKGQISISSVRDVLVCIFLIFFLFQIDASETLIKTKIIKENKIVFHLSPEFTKKYVRYPLALTYPKEIDLTSLPSTIIDIPLITNVIAVIWLSGKEYAIEEMDEDLYYSLIKIKMFFKRFFFNTSWEGKLKPERLVKNFPSKTISRPAALFTGGLDSTTTLLRHFNENPILIAFNNPHKNAVDFAALHQFDFYRIYFNHNEFLKLTLLNKASTDISKWFWDTTMGLAWVGAATPMLYAMGIQTLYIPSGFTWGSFILPDGQAMRQSHCPLIDENLSPMGLRVKHDIFTMTRPDKIKYISTFCKERNISKPTLVVCNRHRRGDQAFAPCNRCMKCLITMLDILAIAEDWQDYGFILSKEEFIFRFQHFITGLKTKRGGTYAACCDSQNYIRKNLENLIPEYRAFYEWFISIDLWNMIDEKLKSPPRDSPFSWNDYKDLYPGIEGVAERH